jgi:hypothetical protein
MTAETGVTADKVIAAYVTLRDQRSALKQDYEEADQVLKDKMRKLEIWLKQQMELVGSDQLAAHNVGTAYREIERKYSASDWTLVWGYMKEHDRFDLLQKRLGEGTLNEILKETGELPPGVRVHSEYVIKVRRK